MNRNQYIICGILILISFASGRFLTPTKVVVKTNTVTVEKVIENKDIKQQEKIVQVKKADGTVVTTTDIGTVTQDHTNTDKNINAVSVTTTTIAKPSMSVNVLLKTDISNNSLGFKYGVQISKSILGPIEGGIFLFKDGMMGLNVGIRF